LSKLFKDQDLNYNASAAYNKTGTTMLPYCKGL